MGDSGKRSDVADPHERIGYRFEVERGSENLALPDDLDYADVHGLSIEARQKLQAQRPQTLGQASRISGITPASISLLLVYLKRKSRGVSTGRTGKAA